ncbi:protein tesmin/TSO1-like CXC 2 [Dioscorea cayenensis subsp. rotundata]|uniref:Protein tesmin/TSO1-like CXC 2 n=1 Tax=Dioscorea cayennensis subsp. rotundata TaxID=55577 RepID=A0AB40CMJ0_DIOCR|nr:protein tesmin/TSO1-like CXC 2 [Dioscorea cayenensis subsp. rotundata]
MDTPERSKVVTPISKFEDSPVFNFINNLSPIQPVKSVNAAQTFHSLSYASITSIFTSPHVNPQKELRSLLRHSFSELPKHETSSDIDNGHGLCVGEAQAIRSSGCTVKCSLNEANLDPPDECPDVSSDLAKSEPCDGGSPNHNITPFYIARSDLKWDVSLDKRKGLFLTQVEHQDKHDSKPNEEELTQCGWENLIGDDADNLLIFDPSTEADAFDGPNENSQENDVKLCNSFPSSLQRDVADDVAEGLQLNVSFLPCPEEMNSVPDVDHIKEQVEMDQTPQIFLENFQNHSLTSDRNHKLDYGFTSGISIACKVEFQQQRGTRRRCLNFEVPGVPKMSLQSDSTSHNLISCPSDEEHPSVDSHPVPLRAGSPCMLPGIGLHLNTLAKTSRDKLLTRGAMLSGRRLISMPSSAGPLSPFTGQEHQDKSLSIQRDLELPGNEIQDLMIVQNDASEVPALTYGEDLRPISPKKKRRKSEIGSESDSCKRCNCKKSQCLKLYCECFAAGVFCVEPCSCQGCFNKPIHQEKVLTTRKQIESRNPIAFAPKVIRASESSCDTGEDTNKTPASARHKRGCNCKKSSCLKKYCECYQGGVGCSVSCRCEGCKNAFGRKDGISLLGDEEFDQEEEKNACEETDKPDEGQQNANIQTDIPQFPENMSQSTPTQDFRPPQTLAPTVGDSSQLESCTTLRNCDIPLPQCGKFGSLGKSILGDDTPAILRGNRSLISGVKASSPNRKRVSPPHIGTRLTPNHKGGRKLILKSIPSFPSLNTDVNSENPMK